MANQLSEYEIQRLHNIKKNHEYMKSLGLPVPLVPAGVQSRPRRAPAKRCKTLSIGQGGESSDESSDDSDDDWVPGSEEVRRRNKMIKRFIPDFRPKPQTVPDQQRQMKIQVVEDEQSCPTAFEELGRLEEEVDSISDESTVISVKQDKKTQQEISRHQPPEKRIKYATRGMMHFYCEAEVPDDDHYIFCEECQDLHYGDCPVHGPLQIIADRITAENSNLSIALSSLPAVLEIKTSSIPGAGLGVFSITHIPKQVRFGPYKGKKIKWESITDEMNTCYIWEIVRSGKLSHFVNGHDESQSNWMRFVNCSRCEDEQNMVAFQFRGEIYYRTYKSINPGEELLVWYGESYARDLGISLVDDQDRSSTKSVIDSCDGCGKMFTSINFLLRHKKHYCSIRTETRIWQCNICEKRFTSLDHFNRHISFHVNEQQNPSKRSFPKNKYLWTDQAKSSHKRSQSDKSLNHSSALTMHHHTQRGEKLYKCTQCGESFKQSGHLTKHLCTHTGEKPYQCTQCCKSFSNSSALTVHLRTHTGEKPYQCTQCCKSFSNSSHLTVHLRTHTGEKPYQCTQCCKSFSDSSHLTKHLRTHTGEKPYQCT